MAKEMTVLKRNGDPESVLFDEILVRLKSLGGDLNINYTNLVIKTVNQLYDNISTSKIDELVAELCASMATEHLDYNILAGKIVISNNHKDTESDYKKIVSSLYFFSDTTHKERAPLVSEKFYTIVHENSEKIQKMIDYSRDYLIDYFGWKTLARAYLLKLKGKIVERPQHMWMRVALSIHGNDMPLVQETYDFLSLKFFTHATPTLFNAGRDHAQFSSCFLLKMDNDSVRGIYKTLSDCATISKYAGGIGLSIHNIRAKGSYIRGTNGISNGIVPMLKVYNHTARYIDQGGGRRPGAFAMYLEPWHADIEKFLEMRKNHGDEEDRARDLFYALWIPDLFMKRVKQNGKWTLFCPDEARGLDDTWGEQFEVLFKKYEQTLTQKREILARDLWFKILDSQIETGMPYICYKDACNKKSNQQNLGIIKSSNLCAEINLYSDENETAVCNLASIALPKFVNDKQFDYDKMHKLVKVIVMNVNKTIDINFYPTKESKLSNLLHRPIGIGVQGLADVFALMDIPFYSEEAKVVNKQIFETIYHSAIEKSMELSRERVKGIQKLKTTYGTFWKFMNKNPDCRLYCAIGPPQYKKETWALLEQYKPIYAEIINSEFPGAYSSFAGSPLSKGKFQFDLWDISPTKRYDWKSLREKIQLCGIRNSKLIALMPTASTSQILGNNECFEPFTSNIYVRRTLAGEFICINKYLQKDLYKIGLWNKMTKNSIIEKNGSIQHLKQLSQHLRDKYRTVWEIPQKHLIDMARDRGCYVCQSQSMNIWMKNPDYRKLTAMHFYGWKAGLKTGLYYLRTQAKAAPQQFTIEPIECLSCGS